MVFFLLDVEVEFADGVVECDECKDLCDACDEDACAGDERAEDERDEDECDDEEDDDNKVVVLFEDVSELEDDSLLLLTALEVSLVVPLTAPITKYPNTPSPPHKSEGYPGHGTLQEPRGSWFDGK